MLTIVAALTLGQFTWGEGPTVYGVGAAPPSGEWTVKLVRTLDGYRAPCIVAGDKCLPATATAAEIRAALKVTTPSLQVTKPKDYATAYWEAHARGLPLVVFIGYDAGESTRDWLSVRVESLEYIRGGVVYTYPSPSAVLLVPREGGNVLATFDFAPGAAAIRKQLGLEPMLAPTNLPRRWNPYTQPVVNPRSAAPRMRAASC